MACFNSSYTIFGRVFADSLTKGSLQGGLVVVEVMVWLSIVVITVLYWAMVKEIKSASETQCK